MIILLILLVFVAVVASTWWFGIWNNVLTLVNLILAGLIASGFYENVASNLQGSLSDFKAVLSFISVWLTFAVSFILLRVMTDMISSKKLKFEKTTELIGQSVLSVWIACVFVAFTLFDVRDWARPNVASVSAKSFTWGAIVFCGEGVDFRKIQRPFPSRRREPRRARL